eukprot:scaffold115845_cov58-Phaeocystis_antarctica.AAC.4
MAPLHARGQDETEAAHRAVRVDAAQRRLPSPSSPPALRALCAGGIHRMDAHRDRAHWAAHLRQLAFLLASPYRELFRTCLRDPLLMSNDGSARVRRDELVLCHQKAHLQVDLDPRPLDALSQFKHLHAQCVASLLGGLLPGDEPRLLHGAFRCDAYHLRRHLMIGDLLLEKRPELAARELRGCGCLAK